MNLYTWPPFPFLRLPCSSASDSALALQPLLVSHLPSTGISGLTALFFSCSYLEKPAVRALAFTPCTAVEEDHNPDSAQLASWSPPSGGPLRSTVSSGLRPWPTPSPVSLQSTWHSLTVILKTPSCFPFSSLSAEDEASYFTEGKSDSQS